MLLRILFISLGPLLGSACHPAPPSQAVVGADALMVSPAIHDADWPWWRGPQRNGHSLTNASLPVRFSSHENVRWRTPIPGRGHSSPVVVRNRVFLTRADTAAEMQNVLAFDLASGEMLWQRTVSTGGFPKNNHPKNTEATSTLASDGERLFATFFHHRQIELVALSIEGEPLWRRVAGPYDPKKYEYGYAPSPVLYGSAIIVSTEHDGPSFLTAFDRQSGEELWRTPRPSNISFSSPVVAAVAGRHQLLLSGSDKLSSYDPASGKLLWEVAGTTTATCGTAVWNDHAVFASGGYPGSETLAVMSDGTGEVLWKNNQKCYEQSMISIDGYLYSLTDKGVLYCWRESDGQEMWRERLRGPVSASPIFATGHIYWFNESGTCFVFKPNAERFDLVAENRLGDEAFASPAVSGRKLLLRVAHREGDQRQEFLYCFEQQL